MKQPDGEIPSKRVFTGDGRVDLIGAMIHPSGFFRNATRCKLRRSLVLTEGALVASAQRSVLRIVDGGPRNLELEWLVPSIAAWEEPAVARFYDALSPAEQKMIELATLPE